MDWVPSCDLEDSAAVEVSTFLPDIILIPLSMMVNILILGLVSLYRRLMPMKKDGSTKGKHCIYFLAMAIMLKSERVFHLRVQTAY